MPGHGNFLLYTAQNGAVKADMFSQGEIVWLSQEAPVELFGVQVPGIAKHLKNIFESGELSREATVSKMEMVRSEGQQEMTWQVPDKQKGGSSE